MQNYQISVLRKVYLLLYIRNAVNPITVTRNYIASKGKMSHQNNSPAVTLFISWKQKYKAGFHLLDES